MNDFPEPKLVDIGGLRLAAYEKGEGALGRPPVVLVHGWPEIAYSWKNQIGPFADAGYRVIALDLKGFGASEAPPDKALYDVRHMTDDFARLLDALSIDKAVFCGHDWGGALVWPMAQLHKTRVAGVIGLSTPHRAPPPVPPLAIIEKRFTANHYFIRFQEEGAPERLFESDVERFVAFMFRKPAAREKWPLLVPGVYDLMTRFAEGRAPARESLVVSEEDRAVYVRAYRRSGFRGGVNLYRNVDRNWEIMRDVDPKIAAPALWIGGELDLFLPPESADNMGELIPDLEKHVLSGCGHWLTWEKPAELNALIIDWLKRRFR
jgi:microsomal epoxide hydrolase/non-specific protein-tyrosine kinase